MDNPGLCPPDIGGPRPSPAAVRAIVRSPTGACLRVAGIGPSGAWIGRSDRCDIVVDDPARIVSARHCRVDPADGRFWVTDHSSNGTTLNGAPLTQGGRQPLEAGDTLGLGGFTIAFEPAIAGATDPAAAVAQAAPPHAAWDIEETPAATTIPRFGTTATGPDPLHDLLDDLIAQPPPSDSSPRADVAEPDRRLALFMPERARPSNPAVAPFWYGLGVAPPPTGPDDPAELMIELGAALRALSEGLGRRLTAEATADTGNPLLAGPEALRHFLATRPPHGTGLDKFVRDALGRLDTQATERRRTTRTALDTALRTMTPRAVEARFGGMIRGWRRGARRAALLDLLNRMEDELVELAETRFLRDIDAPPAAPAERGR